MKNKRGQQAMEWILTWGWLILAIIIIVLIIGYYYFSSDTLINPDEHTIFFENFECFGERYCKDIGLELREVVLYSEDIICFVNVENLTEIEYRFEVVNKTNIINKYPECLE